MGMLTALGIWPEANSCGSRTSTTVQALVPIASSRSAKQTISGSEPALKRENIFQDILPPGCTDRLCERPYFHFHIDRHGQVSSGRVTRASALNGGSLHIVPLPAIGCLSPNSSDRPDWAYWLTVPLIEPPRHLASGCADPASWC